MVRRLVPVDLKQTAINLDRGLTPVKAVAAPRISSRNTAATAEPGLIVSDVGKQLAARLGPGMSVVATVDTDGGR